MRAITRQEALKKVEKKESSNREAMVITYHPNLPSVSNIVKKHWHVMINDNPKLKRCFLAPSVVAYRRSKNLRDHLIKAKLPSRKTSGRKKNGFTKCGGFCVVCQLSESSSSHTNSKTGDSWRIHADLNCKSENVIYRITCRKCRDFVYVGETSRKFQKRVTEHKGYITQKKPNCIGEHFNSRNHNYTDMLPVPIEQVLPSGDTLLRRRRERLWIVRYDAKDFGANRKY